MSDEGFRCRLYLLTPPQIDLAVFPDQLKAALDAGDVACLQLRLKDAGDDDIAKAFEVLAPITDAHDVALIINDRPDLAAGLGADGVHIGQDDTPYKDARKLVGDDAIVGVTAHDSRHLAMVAAEAGADYVAFGAFYDTQTKQPKSRAKPDLLRWWQQVMEVPCVAIGGITPDNAAPLISAGADFLAVSSGVWNHADGPAEAVKKLNGLMDEVPPQTPH